MIERTVIEGRPCTVAYLTMDWKPAERDDFEMVRILYDDGGSALAVRQDDEEDEGEAEDAWTEQDHPRGQPKNKGQFTAKGSGAGSSGAGEKPAESPHNQPRSTSHAAERQQRTTPEGSPGSVPESYSRRGDRDGGGVRLRSGVRASYEPTGEARERFGKLGSSAPEFDELEPTHESAERFAKAISASKNASAFGAAVHVHPLDEYKSMRLFMTPDGGAGFALNDKDDIVSAFRAPNGPKGAVPAMLDLAVQEGGRRLDCFDTVLPGLYARNGFRAVARTKFNDEYRPDDWNYQTFDKFNHGRPDVVFMVYDPADAEAYKPGDGTAVSDYDAGTDLQKRTVAELWGKGAADEIPGLLRRVLARLPGR